MPVLARYHAKAIILFLSGVIHSDSDAEGLGLVRQCSERAVEQGSAPKDLYGLVPVDPLTVNAKAAREAISRIEQTARARLGMGTVCRPADVSLWSPQRALIELAIAVTSVAAGLSAGCIDPTNRDLNELHHAAILINGLPPRDSDQRESTQI